MKSLKDLEKFIAIILVFVCVQEVLSEELSCSSVNALYKNIDHCDQKETSLSGKVSQFNKVVSKSGNKFTVFKLNDYSNKEPIVIFSYDHLDLNDGDVISVKGVFEKVILMQDVAYPVRLRPGGMRYIENQSRITYTLLSQGLKSKILKYKQNLSEVLKNLNLMVFLSFALLTLVILIIFSLSRRSKKFKEGLKEQEITKEKGDQFEKYVVDLISDREWIIEDWTRDSFHKAGNRKVSSDQNPDLLIKHKETAQLVYIECKYRLKPLKERVDLAYLEQYNRYKEKDKKVPVFICLGLGNKAESPEKLFLIPLYCLKAYQGKISVQLSYLNQFQIKNLDLDTFAKKEKRIRKISNFS